MQRLFIFLELLLYAGAVLLAAGALDFLIRLVPAAGLLRAGLWGLTYLGFAALFALYPNVLMQAMRAGWPLLLWPAMALLSYLWSADKSSTLVAGMQLLSITLFGMFMGARLGVAAMTRILFLVLGVTAVLSLGVIGLGEVAKDHHGNLIGAFSHKNVTGNRMAVLILASTILVAAGQWRWMAIPAFLLAALVLVLSGSATALVAIAACLFGLAMLYCLDLPGQLRVLGLSLVALAGTAVLFGAYWVQVNLPEAALEMLGKDTTLTGRSTLWEFALRSIAEKPGFGYGYDAFWTGDRFDAEWLRWIMEQRLAHFHNGFLDIGVQLGIPGMVAQVGIMLLFIWKAFRYMAADGSAFGWMPLALMALIVVSNTAEVIVFTRHGFLQFLMCAVYVRMVLAVVPRPTVTWTPAPARMQPRMQEGWQ
ncbi:O-antigen ligase family protein [Indioceanicola profundi]|uniref:O-antigen ligase family protein n=1 Tax=Indioceanicola profundi TaxID=2220096 RepID=UPI0013C52A12|nr:O-antigen ligase family protein [Indioceanicola profundi]